MSATAQIEVYGLKEALKELRQVEPDFRKIVNKEAKDLAKPAVDDAKAAYPPRLLSGMERAWTQRGNAKFPYSQQKAQRGVSVKVDTSKRNSSVISIIQKDPAAAIIDMAGKKGGSNAQGARFISALTLQFGLPSRVMWPAYDRNARAVEQNMVELVERVMDAVNRNLVM
jgi:hypothetical protein